MEILQDIEINQIIEKSLSRSISYTEYRKLVEDLSIQNSTTGNEKTEALADYTKLNDRRMKRWDKTLKISDDIKEQVSQFSKKIVGFGLSDRYTPMLTLI